MKHAKGVKLAPLGGGANIFATPLPSLGAPQSHATFKSPAPNKGAKLAPMGKIFLIPINDRPENLKRKVEMDC